LPGQEAGARPAGRTNRVARADLDRACRQPRLFRLLATNKGGFLQIVDRDKLINGPKEPTPDNLRLPEISRMPMSAMNGAHTTFSDAAHADRGICEGQGRKSRDIVMIVDEAILNECNEPRQMVWFADVTVENRPMMISSFTVPEASGSFCERGRAVRLAFLQREHGAGLLQEDGVHRLLQCRRSRARHSRPLPPQGGRLFHSVDHRRDRQALRHVDGKDRCKVAIQTNNLETDARGYIYIVDRANTGLHILELTGPARAVAGLP